MQLDMSAIIIAFIGGFMSYLGFKYQAQPSMNKQLIDEYKALVEALKIENVRLKNEVEDLKVKVREIEEELKGGEPDDSK